jgi:hypothetical protein
MARSHHYDFSGTVFCEWMSLSDMGESSARGRAAGAMHAKVDGLCAERDRQVCEERRKYRGTNKVINRPIERRFR